MFPIQKVVVDARETSIILVETPTNPSSTGMKLWPAAKVLLAWVEQIQRTSPKSLAGKRVIELGSGIGLSGIAFLLAGCDVTFTDQAVMIPLLKQNVEVNSVNAGARTRAHVAEFNWGDSVESLQPPFDIIVATDVIYKMELIEPLVRSMRELSTEDTRIMICLEQRDPFVYEEAFRQFGEFFNVKKIRKNKLPKVDELEFVDAYELSKLPEPQGATSST